MASSSRAHASPSAVIDTYDDPPIGDWPSPVDGKISRLLWYPNEEHKISEASRYVRYL